MTTKKLKVYRDPILSTGSDCPPLKRLKSSTSGCRIPLSDISPSAKSAPVRIPRISIHEPEGEDDDFDDVFHPSLSDKENFASGACKNRQVLFPSYGTSPSKALNLEEGSMMLFDTDLSMDSNVKKLGKGSFGTVVLGFWEEERVAFKIIQRRSSLDNELNALTLSHNNVTKIKKVIESLDQRAIIVMEYVGQNNLQALIENSKLTNELSKSFLKQIAKGLNYCHSNLIAHLDLKPANVLVSACGDCKLADFGCSQRFLSTKEALDIDNCPGTPGYQAPELFRKKKAHLKSDIFSFGIVMWQIMAKQSQPYPGWHAHTIIFKVTAQDIRPDDGRDYLLPNVWNRYQSLYKTCWSSDIGSRPTSGEVLQALTRLTKSSGTPSKQRERTPSSRKSSGIRI